MLEFSTLNILLALARHRLLEAIHLEDARLAGVVVRVPQYVARGRGERLLSPAQSANKSRGSFTWTDACSSPVTRATRTRLKEVCCALVLPASANAH
jgi:hypothetical protein